MDAQSDLPANQSDGHIHDTVECNTPTTSDKVFPPQQIASSRKRKLTDVERTLIKFMDTHGAKMATPQQDEDLAFFYSILPTVKKLPPNKKFTFRMESMRLLQNLQEDRAFPLTAPLYQSCTSRPPSSTSAASFSSNFSPSTEGSHEHDSPTLT
jgi:hypothetical protein